ncbi:MAG TPA: hypothetical protein VJY62_22305, partial [Bacteroidia bacterium]|nr:hypothetical protein [Bacteroidia bacterium]
FAEEILLIYGCFFSCLLIHTLSYCLPGVLNNLGMGRYMATLIPVASLIALRGLNLIVLPLKKFYFLQITVAISFTAFILISPFKQSYYPFGLDGESQLTKKAVEWMKRNNLTYTKICFFPAGFSLFYELDPFNDKKVVYNIKIDQPLPSYDFPKGSVLVWDSHYGANEGQIPIEKLENNHDLQLLQKFEPEHKFTVLGNHPFEIRIYKVK